MASRSRGDGNYRNPCLTMHQPWASLLVYGIKRIEGRSWPSPITGRLWIHAAGKVPEPETIKAMEDFYRQLYALDGVTDLKFPEHYPVSRLLGCVEVVGCVTSEELVSWEDVSQGIRLEGQTPFCWLCERPQKLLVPFEMRGYQGVYNLEKRILEGALRGLCPVEAQSPVKFPLPYPRKPLALKPGSVARGVKNGSNTSTKTNEGSSPNLASAIAGARAAATQFSKKSYGPRIKNKDQEQGARTIGFQGQGFQGFQGQGFPSPIGFQGFQGFQGQGFQGFQGFQGQGFQGFQGFQGQGFPSPNLPLDSKAKDQEQGARVRKVSKD